MEKFVFDQITGFLEDFHEQNKTTLAQSDVAIYKKVFKPLTKYASENISISDLQSALLYKCAPVAIKLAQNYCKGKSVDKIYSLIKRYPICVYPSQDWEKVATIIALKFGDNREDVFVQRGEYNHALHLAYSSEDLYDTHFICTVADTLAYILAIYRTAGKGMKYKIHPNGKPVAIWDRELNNSIASYDRRGKDISFFSYEGVVISNNLNAKEIKFIWPYKILKPITFQLKSNNTKLFLHNYFYSVEDGRNLISTLLEYENPIFSELGINIGHFIQLLYGLTENITATFPIFTDYSEDGLACDLDLSEQDTHRRVAFFFSLCQSGYLRFNVDYISSEVIRYQCPTNQTIVTQKDIENLIIKIDNFFKNNSDVVEVFSFKMRPFIYLSSNGICYIEIPSLVDFCNWLVSKGKEWYSTQHGDKFTFYVAELIGKRCKEAKVISCKKKFTDHKNRQIAETDIIIEYANCLYIIECKAYAKNYKYWRGDRNEITRRSAQVAEAVKQAKSTISRVQGEQLFLDKKVDWIVCTPSQEFLHPIDMYGMLAIDVPKVCTPGELVKFLSRETDDMNTIAMFFQGRPVTFKS